MIFGLFIIGVTLMFISFRFKSRLIPILYISILLTMIYFNNYNPDYDGYKNVYDNINSYSINRFEFGFTLLMKFGNMLNLNYNLFVTGLYTFGFIIIYIILAKNSMSMGLFFLLITIFPLFLDLIQVRHFLASTLFFVAMYFYTCSNYKTSFIIFLTASSIQFVTLLLLPIYILRYDKSKFVINILLIFSFLFTIFVIITPYENVLFNYILTSLKLNRYLSYVNTEMNMGVILFLLLSIFSYGYSRFLSNAFLKNGVDRSEINYRLGKLITVIGSIIMVYTPLMLINSNFTRLIRFPVLLYIFASLTVVSTTTINTRRKVKIYTIVYIFTLFLILIAPSFDSIVLPFFENTTLR